MNLRCLVKSDKTYALPATTVSPLPILEIYWVVPHQLEGVWKDRIPMSATGTGLRELKEVVGECLGKYAHQSWRESHPRRLSPDSWW
jgi:hypothetical protein